MAAACMSRRLLRRFEFSEVKDINVYCDLPPRKSKEAMVDQLVHHYGRDLARLVSGDGPYTLEVWNQRVELLGGARRKSFGAVRDEIEAWLDPVFDDLDGDSPISEVRENTAVHGMLARKLGLEPDELAARLKTTHGLTLLAKFVTSVREDQRATAAASAVKHDGLIDRGPTQRPGATGAASSPATIRVASTRTKATNVERLALPWMSTEVATSVRLDIAAGFYDVDFLRGLFRANGSAKGIRLMFNGLGGQRLAEQQKELLHLQRVLAGEDRDVQVRLSFAPGMFHSKLFLLHERRGTRAIVGSANATNAAFERNEELMLVLSSGVAPLVDYFDAVWRAASPLDQLDVTARSLIAFLRTGVLYFKPSASLQTTINPFTELLSKLTTSERLLLGGVRLPHADPGTVLGPFNLRAAVRPDASIPEPQDDDLPPMESDPVLDGLDGAESVKAEKVARAGIKPWSVETCYGYWVPSTAEPRLLGKLTAAGDLKKAAWLQLRSRLDSVDSGELRNKYGEYVASARGALQQLPRLGECLAQLNADPFTQQTFDNFLGRVVDHLDDDARINRLSMPYTSGAVPELWDDPIAFSDLRSSFFDYLDHIAQRPGKKPHVPGRILKHLDTTSRVDLGLQFERYLETEGWHEDDWALSQVSE